ncbi:diaminopimelate decarboxylase [Halospeciosus flavus]|uniref:Diaminopimelate decarboxylase n=1 Tax=Halospeciosus flavus TaxID=3032283 RepID=A0ABD5Z530_9EURY|nr:diaminopimelate decarboxylase [Halospeciosus flavus]
MEENPAIRRLSDWSETRLRGLADEYDTPLYVTDLDRVRENYARILDAFPDAEVLYAVKANAGRDVLSAVADAGAGAECASAGEVERAVAAGFDPEDVHYTAVNPPAEDLDYVVDLAEEEPALTITAGAADTVDRLAERGFDGRFCLRVHPGVGAGHHEDVATGADAKFGVPGDRAAAVVEQAQDYGMDVVGVHAHVGSGVSNDDLESHRRVVEYLAEVVSTLPVDLEFVDVGGGFGVPYHESEEPLDLDAVADNVRSALAGVDAQLVVEPGRYFVADAGVLLTEVNTVKADPAGETLIAGVDAGMTTLIRPALYDAYHPIANVAADAADRSVEPTSVVGPVCESADVLGENRDLPLVERGDLLAVGNAGAYGIEMANQYNSRPRPAAVALEAGDASLARRRETVADITDTEVWQA